MSVVVKVIIDEKEYDRLVEIEQKYKELSQTTTSKSAISQTGAGKECYCNCAQATLRKNIPLDEIVTRNEEAQGVETPIPGILPSITVASEPGTSYEKKKSASTPAIEEKSVEKEASLVKGSGAEDELGVAKFMHPWYYIGAPHPHQHKQ